MNFPSSYLLHPRAGLTHPTLPACMQAAGNVFHKRQKWPTESRGMFFAGQYFGLGSVACLEFAQAASGCESSPPPSSRTMRESTEMRLRTAGDKTKRGRDSRRRYCTPFFPPRRTIEVYNNSEHLCIHNRPPKPRCLRSQRSPLVLIRPTKTRGTTAVLSGPSERQSPRILGP